MFADGRNPQRRASTLFRQGSFGLSRCDGSSNKVPRSGYLAIEINTLGVDGINNGAQSESHKKRRRLNRRHRFLITATRAGDQIRNRERALFGVVQLIWTKLGQIPPKITRQGSEVGY